MKKLILHFNDSNIKEVSMSLYEITFKGARNFLQGTKINVQNFEEEVKSPEKLYQKVKAFLQDAQIKPSVMDVIISSPEIFFYPIQLPTMKTSELEKSLDYEVSSQFSDFYTKYVVIPRVFQHKNTSTITYVAFCPLSYLKLATVISSMLGISLQRIISSQESFYNEACEKFPSVKEAPSRVFAYITEKETLFVFEHEGVPYHQIIYSIGLHSVNKILMEKYDISEEDARILRNYCKNGNIEINDSERQYVYSAGLKKIISQIKKFIYLHETGYEQEPVNQVVIATNDLDARLIREHIKKDLSIPVDFIDIENLEEAERKFFLCGTANAKPNKEEIRFKFMNRNQRK